MGGGTEQGNNSARGALTVSARVSNGASRYAMPSIPELVYAALLYKDGNSPENPPSADFVEGTKAADSDNLIFSFQKPENTSGTFTLEVFAFVKSDVVAGDGTTTFSRNSAPFSKAKTGLTITGDAIDVGDIVLEVNALPSLTGTVSLQIKVPDGCSLEIKELKADGTTESNPHFKIDETLPEFTITQNGTGISAGTYPVNFTVKKSGVTVYIFTESINVLPGLCTDTWGGLAKGAAKDIAQSMSTTLYVRGAGGWYDSTSPYNDGENAKADDTNLGSFSSPLATIQKAVDKIIAINDGTSPYTICVDGTLNGADGIATFSALKEKELNLTIKALSGTATLDGGARFDADGNVIDADIKKRVIDAYPTSGTLNLTLVNLTVTGGNIENSFGGGIRFASTGGTLKIGDGTTISGNKAVSGGGVYVNSGTFTMEGGAISENIATSYGGGVYIKTGAAFEMSGTAKIADCKFSSTGIGTKGCGIYNEGTLTITGGTISGCNLASYGGGIYNANDASITSTIKNCTISGCTAKYGGGIYNNGSLTIESGTTISGCESTLGGGGIYNVGASAVAKITGCTIEFCKSTSISSSDGGGGICNSGGTLTVTGGTISECTAEKGSGGGIYLLSSSATEVPQSTITGVDISECTAKNGGGVYIGSGTKFTMTGGTIGGNSATTQGSGVYIVATSSAMGTFNMSGAAQISEDNDVYLSASGSNIATITVAGDLTADSPVATIKPSSYAAGRQVLTADGTNVTAITQDICDKFALTPAPAGASWEIVPNDDGTAGVLLFDSALYVSSGGDDTNGGGTKAKPFATIQKAVDTVIAQNDGASEYTIYVDGTLTQSVAANANGMADFSALNKNLTLTIKALSGTATLDANQKSRVIYAKPTSGMLNLTLGNLTVTGGQTTGGYPTGNGSGIYFESSGGNLAMNNGTITGNTATNDGGGVCIASGTFTMGGGTISSNTAPHGGGVYISGKFIMNAGEISGNTTEITGGSTGGGVWNDGTFEMNGGTISNNRAGTGGGGVYLKSPGTFTMSGGEITGNNANMGGGGVYIYSGTFKISDGTITGNTAAGTSKNGVYGTFTKNGGTVQSD